MAIKIELINCAQDPTIRKPEESAAAEIKKQFQKEFSKYPNAKGTLYILRSLSIFGYPVRDLDLVLIGSFQNFQFKGKFNTINYGEINDLNISIVPLGYNKNMSVIIPRDVHECESLVIFTDPESLYLAGTYFAKHTVFHICLSAHNLILRSVTANR